MKTRIGIVITLLLDLACLIWSGAGFLDEVAQSRMSGMLFYGLFLLLGVIGIPDDIRKASRLFRWSK